MGVAGLVGLKKRIRSVESTRKLTKAMALVATSKLKRVRRILDVNNDYFEAYKQVMDEVAPSLPRENRYMMANHSDRKLIIVAASDMGMCGSYNNTIVDVVRETLSKEPEKYELLVLGERGKALCKRHGINTIDSEIKVSDVPEVSEADAVFNYAFKEFSEGRFCEVILMYSCFKNTISREVRTRKLFPLNIEEEKSQDIHEGEFDLEGDGEALMEALIPSYCKSLLFNIMLNAKASEHSVRTETMNSATQNADDLISALKLKYNRIRQGAITQEITEIVSGVDAQG